VRFALLLAALAGCRFEPGELPGGVADDAMNGGDGGGSDGNGSGSGSDAYVCTDHVLPPTVNVDPATWSASFLTAPAWQCTAAGTTTIDSTAGTAASTSCALGTPQLTNDVAQLSAGASNVLVVRLRGLTLTNGHILRLVGNKPIVLLVEGDVLVDTGGRVDAGAKGATPGPGGSPASCVDRNTGRGGPYNSSSGWGGGGGAFGSAGGQGGYDTLNGGLAVGDPSLVPLRGGCQGGIGGGSTGGGGGGAFQISATGTITIGDGGVLAATGGGAPASTSGGNGGGAGGGILLVSPTAAVFGTSGAARAHGGSGGEGCGGCGTAQDAGGDGHIGDDNVATDASGIAGGGNGNDRGRAGGLAYKVGTAAVMMTPGAMTTAQDGGRGGGGGGGGRIAITTGASTPACD
jgi:hypothetical protein